MEMGLVLFRVGAFNGKRHYLEIFGGIEMLQNDI